ncbi:PGAP1-like protein-domain-containing protein [Lactarius hengduanensis]|nr:PGAP1-like protein-domain-containing protein [Lactarius hengduanensis]
MAIKSSIFVALFSIASVGLVYRAASDSATTLSPQGCRMSYMSPSYLVQSQFDTSWTPLAKRYSLLLYKRLVPVLFIPGNAGSAHQIRSIASSAARQYYASPYTSSPEFTSRAIQPLDFFAVDYNEDLSAFHGPTLDVETAYASSAISYILSLYPPGTPIVVMGHSMGGVVATSILPSPNISAVITMSTPHQLPPARFDRRIAAIYNSNRAALVTANTPILSLCGGAADLMVPSESCILPEAADVGVYRRTVFSSALEGCWTGVGHQVVVWCHQVRWRVARAALELGAASTSAERGAVLDRWLRDGRSPPPALGYPTPLHLNQANYTVLPPGPVILRALRVPGAVHLAPVPETASPTKFVAYVSDGSVLSMGPYHASSLSVSFHLCLSKTDDASPSACEELHPSSLKLIPNPLPRNRVDESDGVVVFEAILPGRKDGERRWVAIAYSTNEERGWILGGFEEEPTVMKFSVHDLLYKGVTVPVNPNNVHSDIRLPSLLSNALVVYRVGATYASDQGCDNPLLTPLLEHTSPSEAHFYPLTHARPLLLHTHSWRAIAKSHLCTCAWTGRGSLGRAGARYWTAVPGWAVGVVAWMLFSALGEYERGAPMPSVSESLSVFTRATLPRLLGATLAISLLPLPRDYVLGNGGEIVFAPLAPLVLLIATGLVTVSWWVLCITMWPIRKAGRADAGITRNTVLSMLLVLLLVALLVPWQVAFLGCWSIHLVTCATHVPAPPGDAPTPHPRSRSPTPDHRPAIPPVPRSQRSAVPHDAEHALLLLTWLLPLAAPVLAAPADHGVWSVAPYLVLVDFASWTRDALFQRDRVEIVSARWGLLPPAVVAFLRGARHTYEVFDCVWGAVTVLVVLRVGPRYWGVSSWSSVLGSRAQSPS